MPAALLLFWGKKKPRLKQRGMRRQKNYALQPDYSQDSGKQDDGYAQPA